MNKWNITLPDGREIAAEVKLQGGDVEVVLDGKSIYLAERELAQWKGQSLLADGQLLVTGPTLQRAFDIKPFMPKTKEEDQGHKQLKALFPGKVIQVLPKENAWAESGELLVVMESMKMEYHYQAPKRIFIEKILIRPGEVLTKGKEFFLFHE